MAHAQVSRREGERRYIEKRKRLGLCISCTCPTAETSTWLCEYHLAKHRKIDRKRYAKRKDLGICPNCRAKSEKGHVFCEDCREEKRSHYHNTVRIPKKLISAIADTDFSNDVKNAILLDGEYCDKELKKRGLVNG